MTDTAACCWECRNGGHFCVDCEAQVPHGHDCPPVAICGAQDWAYDDNDEPFIYGTCELLVGHESRWHQQQTPSGKVWAEWSGPRDERAPAGARDGFEGRGPHD